MFIVETFQWNEFLRNTRCFLHASKTPSLKYSTAKKMLSELMSQISCNYLMPHTVTIKIQISHPKTMCYVLCVYLHAIQIWKEYFLLIHEGIFDRTNCTQTNSLLLNIASRTIGSIISRGCCLLDMKWIVCRTDMGGKIRRFQCYATEGLFSRSSYDNRKRVSNDRDQMT